jgi:hypothetical protein
MSTPKLLCEITLDAVTYKISNNGWALENYWNPYIIEITPPRFNLANNYGGRCKVVYGEIQLVLELFADCWPPPTTGTISLQYTADNEASAVDVFSGTIHLSSFDKFGVTYEIYETAYEQDLLEEGTDVDSNDVVFPRAFGTVTHQPVIQLTNGGSGNFRYAMAHIVGTSGNCTNSGVWCVYDDGVDISGNVANVSNNMFELTAQPVGEVTICGTGDLQTVEDICAWACGASLFNCSIATNNARSPSPTVSIWASTQEFLINFLSNVTAFYTHLFYIAGSTLTLVDMLTDNTLATLSDGHDFQTPRFHLEAPAAEIKCEWTTNEAYTGNTDAVTVTKYIKRNPNDITVQSNYSYGNKIVLTPYHDTAGDIEDALDDILTVMHRHRTTVVIPMSTTLPVPGQKYTLTTEQLTQALTMWFRVRNIAYDFANLVVEIEGEGTQVT